MILKFCSLQIAVAITSENLITPGDPWITQLPGLRFVCSKEYNLRQFRLTQLQNCTQAPSEIALIRKLAFVFIRAKKKRVQAFRCSAAFQKSRVFCAPSAHCKSCRGDHIYWHTKSLPLPKKLRLNENKNFIRIFNGTDGVEINQ